MQKITCFFVCFLFFAAVYADQGIYTYATSGNIFFYSKNADKVLKLTHDNKNSHPILSPDGRWLVFITKSHDIMPKSCADSTDLSGKYADELWIYDLKTMKNKLFVKDHCSEEPTKMIVDPQNLSFSPDGKTLYFETSAWTTSGAIHAINVNGTHSRFVTDGNEYHVIMHGKYKGDIVANQHRYRFKGDTPLGSYDWDWLFTPAGKQIKMYKKED